jgi:hypothetical protein
MRFALVLLTGVLGVLSAVAADGKPFRLIGIPGREHGYGNLKAQVIGSQKELDALMKAVETQQGWNNREAFLKGLQAGKVNFATEVLVLIRQTEGSGSNRVSLVAPEQKGDKLVCTIQRMVPDIGTDDIADYCFALAVNRETIKTVEVWVAQQGAPKPEKPRDLLTIPAR